MYKILGNSSIGCTSFMNDMILVACDTLVFVVYVMGWAIETHNMYSYFIKYNLFKF
jgi:hypothetical protein